MKKFVVSLLIITMLILTPLSMVNAERVGSVPDKTDHEKVTIHLFYASWCSHCHDFINYFQDKYQDYEDYFEITTYLVSTVGSDNKAQSIVENATIMQTVSEYFKTDNNGEELKGGIPLIIIGDKYVRSGFGSDGSDIIEYALSEYKNKDYKNTVAKIIKDNKLDTSKVNDFANAVSLVNGDTETTKKTETGKYDTVIVVSIFVVLIGGFVGLVILSKK